MMVGWSDGRSSSPRTGRSLHWHGDSDSDAGVGPTRSRWAETGGTRKPPMQGPPPRRPCPAAGLPRLIRVGLRPEPPSKGPSAGVPPCLP